jgi:hypothetical protein
LQKNTFEIEVDAETGSIRIGPFIPAISVDLSQQSFESIYREAISDSRDMNTGYVWVSLGNDQNQLSLEGASAGISLCFFEGRLASVSFGVALPTDELESNWPTLETSLRQVEFLRKSLGKKLGRKIPRSGASFSWGDVWASFDEKGFCAGAGMRYKWSVQMYAAQNKANAKNRV